MLGLSDNLPGWGIIGLILGLVILYFLFDKFGSKQKENSWEYIGKIITAIALILPIVWFFDYITAQTIFPINDNELFTFYEPLFMLLLGVIFGIPTLDNYLKNMGG